MTRHPLSHRQRLAIKAAKLANHFGMPSLARHALRDLRKERVEIDLDSEPELEIIGTSSQDEEN